MNTESLSVELEGEKQVKKDLLIDVRDTGSEYMVVLSHLGYEVFPLPGLNLDEKFKFDTNAGCVLCPKESTIVTELILQILDKLKESGFKICSIKSNTTQPYMFNLKMIPFD